MIARCSALASNLTELWRRDCFWGYYAGPVDRAAAARWYADAVTKGVVEAAVLLGLMHEHGSGVPVDRRAACRVYLRAALQGHSGAAFRLALLES